MGPEPRAFRPDVPWLRRAIELFVIVNLGFLALDVYVAHLENHFRHPAEWVPVVFSCVAPALLLPPLLRPAAGFARPLHLLVGAVAIVVGIAGMLLHLRNTFFVDRTLHNLVYTAPFVAPLAYTGVGLLSVLGELERNPRSWSLWVCFLALSGFVGNFVLALADHAINGFFHATEWISVLGAALAVGFLLVFLLAPDDPVMRRATRGVLWLQVGVGLLGFALHLASPTRGWSTGQLSLVGGAPIFAPLLFPNLAALAFAALLGVEASEANEALDQAAAVQAGQP